MSDITSIIFSKEFIHAPINTISTGLGIISLLLIRPLLKLKNNIFKYRKGHSIILKEAGVPAFVLNAFVLSIPLKKLPSMGLPEKIFTLLFLGVFLFAAWVFIPRLIQTYKTPPDAALLVWIKTNESFYLSQSGASEATAFTNPSWSIYKNECSPNISSTETKIKIPPHDYKKSVCELLTTKKGEIYIEKSIKQFNKNKIIMYSIMIISLCGTLWLSLGFALNIHYSNKVRKYILTEQKKAIHCARGEFKAEGIYEVYQELERKTLC